jgi:hypothetical protein
MDIGFTIAVLLVVFIVATAIGFAWTGFCQAMMPTTLTGW